MSKLQIVRHGDLSIREALDIIDIKSIAWPYDADSQFQWMIRNLRENDLHFLLRDDESNKIIAYLNLVEVEAEFEEGNKIACWGLGNVCAREKGNGKGREIMMSLNDYIKNNNLYAILLCKEKLLEFYRKVGWTELKNETGMSSDIYVMQFGNNKFEKAFAISRVF